MWFNYKLFGKYGQCNMKQEYNNLEHCGLNGKTPNEILQLLLNTKPTNARV